MSKKTYINGDDELCHKAAENIDAKIVTFGFENTNDYYPENVRPGKFGFCFDVLNKGEKLAEIDAKALELENKASELETLKTELTQQASLIEELYARLAAQQESFEATESEQQQRLLDAQNELSALQEEIPMGRLGTGEDVANAVLYLEENEYVTGIDLPVNGGFSVC
jgi:hypothetical protein